MWDQLGQSAGIEMSDSEPLTHYRKSWKTEMITVGNSILTRLKITKNKIGDG